MARTRLRRSFIRMIAGPPNSSIYVGGGVVLARIQSGPLIYLDSRDVSLTPCIGFTGDWEPWIRRAFSRAVFPGACIVDVGANCGFYALAASAKVGETGKIIAIEANPRMVDLLRRSVAANGLMDRIVVKQGAVLDHQGEIELGMPDDFMGSTSILVRQEGRTDAVTTIRAEANLLEHFLDGDLRVDVLKIDTEGAEPLVWRGAKSVIDANPNIKIFVEFAPPMLTATGGGAAFLDAIRREGFSIYEIERDRAPRARSDAELLSRSLTELYLTRSKTLDI